MSSLQKAMAMFAPYEVAVKPSTYDSNRFAMRNVFLLAWSRIRWTRSRLTHRCYGFFAI